MIGIIGAGISGLSLAYHLQKLDIPYILLEASDQAGGYIRTIKDNSTNHRTYILEQGPNSIMIDQEIQQIIEELGIDEELLPSNEVSQNRYVFKNGKYRKLPTKPSKLIFNRFFSFSSKLAIFKERRRPKQTLENETLSQFFERRFSKEIVDYALNPFVAGIYAGDPAQLLISKTFPQLHEYEQNYGSVIKGMVKNKSIERRHTSSFKQGMQTLPKAFAQKLDRLKLSLRVTNVQKTNEGYTIQTDDEQTFQVTQLVIATSAPAAQQFLTESFPAFGQALGKIYYPPMIAVHSTYKRDAIKHPLDGFGGLNPKTEGLYTAGSIWTSAIFSGRCPEDEVLFTTFVGGTQSPQHTTNSKQVTLGKVHQELSEHYQISASPLYQNLCKWDRAIPQYDINILDAHHIADELEQEQLFVCANWKDGISLPDCIKKGKKLAEKLAEKYPHKVVSEK